jgi:hypothetical protein
MYAIINIILIFMWHWSKLRWLILLWGFIFLLYLLMMDVSKNVKKSE